jgi:uncharacterized protein YecE (DUF72 family)
MLEFYATRLNSVEVNYTFRQLPSAATVENWLSQTGADFRFSFKAPQRITHIKRLKDCSEAISLFYAALRPVTQANRLGVILFQLPPNFKADLARLESFLEDAAGALRIAFEFRHSSWLTDEVFERMHQYKAALCVAESDELQCPDVVTAPFSCYRFRKSDYNAADMQQLELQLRSKSEHGEVFAYMKHEDSPSNALQASALLTRLGAQ